MPDRVFPCAQCGAALRFAPGQTRLTCDHCGHVQDIPEAATHDVRTALGEIDYRAALRHLPEEKLTDAATVTCPNCGAHVTLEPGVTASRCPFCATPIAAGGGLERQIRPQAIVPFALTEAKARAAMTGWLGSLWFAPSGLTDYARKGRRLAGVYVPYWTFDAEATTRYQGERGDHYYETRTVMVTVDGRQQAQQQQVLRVAWRGASGTVRRAFDDVLAMAATSLPRDLADGLEPWDLGALRPYAADYVAGFQAEAYTVPLEAGHEIARAAMDRVIEADIRRDIGGDEQRIHAVETALAAETFKHILLPVWLAAYKFRGRSFRFIVNGQTGRVQGERPWSAWKIAFAVIAALLVAAVVAYVAQGR